MIFESLFIISMNYSNTYAIANTPELYQVLSSNSNTPEGIKDLTNWFVIPKLGSNKNNSEILEPQGDVNKTKQAVVKITQQGSQNSFGAVWSRRNQSNAQEQNYIDVTKHQTMSMWLFFGGLTNGRGDVADGMSFVIQNSPDGTNAFNTDSKTGGSDGTGTGGQTLGVWGPVLDNVSNSYNTADYLAKRAIQNSWALEFDTYYNDHNSTATKNSNFDRDVSNGINHIGSNFPASPTTYNLSGSDWSQYGPKLNHLGLIESSGGKQAFLSDGSWHHLTITWLPAGTNNGDSGQTYPEVTYAYDDKNIDGTPETNGASKTVPITETDANGNRIDPFNLGTNKKLYWGFTGSTGSQTENNLVIFESIPSIVEGDLTSTINDITQDNRVLTTEGDSTYDSVNAGDNLAINYNLSYVSGSQSWPNIIANIDLPTNMTYKNAVITYGDANKTTENIALTGSQTNITHTLIKALDKTNIPKATLTVYGSATVPSGATSTKVAAAHASFDGTNLYKDVMTTPFTILAPKTIQLKQNGAATRTLNIGDSTTLSGTVNYSDTIDPTKFQVFETINGKAEPVTTTMSNILGSSNDTFNFPISTNDLNNGENIVKLKVEDQYHNSSNYIYFTIDVAGALLLKTANTSHFKSVQEYPTKRIIPRANDWDVEVIDNRGADQSWTLQAESTGLSNGSTKWTNGGIIYVDKNGDQEPLNTEPTTIASGSKTSADPKIYDVDSTWSNNQGIILKQNSY